MLTRSACAWALLVATVFAEAASIWVWAGAELRLGAPPVLQGLLLGLLCLLVPATRAGRWAGAGVAVGWLAFGPLLDLALLLDWDIPLRLTGVSLAPLLLPWLPWILMGPRRSELPYVAVSGLALLAGVAILARGEPPLSRIALLVAAWALLLRALEFAEWVDRTA